MLGQMMDHQLMISDLIEHAGRNHSTQEIFTRETDGSDHRYTWGDCADRARQLANALIKAGVRPGDKVATIAWNNYRHLEIYYAASGIGAIVHTINPRLKPEQIVWMVNHAEDHWMMFDTTFAPLIDGMSSHCPQIKGWVAMCDQKNMPELKTDLLCYEDMIADEPAIIEWPRFDENTACSLCYTSGTTGNPKGVLYSHRSTILHAWAASSKDVIGISATDVILAVVPMFHISAWGLVYSCAMMGAKIVMPGPELDGKSLTGMIRGEEVTLMAGVPTVWLGILNHLKEVGGKLPSVKAALVGGSALPETLLRAYENDLGIPMIQGWGMTEMSPLGVTNTPLPGHDTLSHDEKVAIKLLAGRAIFGVEMRIVDDKGNELPRNGEADGHLHVRGPWVAKAYYKNDGGDAFTGDGWFRTGDVATLHPSGHLEIIDRSKDVIKSGGEWISSIEVENAAMNHKDVAMAACIGLPHEKWQERPLLIVQPVPGSKPDPEEIKQIIATKCAKWWVPQDIVYKDNLPLGATGKVLKRELKIEYKEYKLSSN